MNEIIDEIYEKNIKHEEFKRLLDYNTELCVGIIDECYENYKDDANRYGEIGEQVVRLVLKWVLWDLKFKRGTLNFNMSYTLDSHYGAPKYSSRGGLDYLLTLRDDIGKFYKIGIEVKNIMMLHYYPDDCFDKDILSRYEYIEPHDKKLLIFNRRNMYLIQDRCDENGISIIPLDNHITQDLPHIKLKMTLRCLYDDLYQNIYNILNTRDICIKRDKILGINQTLISKKYGISQGRVAQIS